MPPLRCVLPCAALALAAAACAAIRPSRVELDGRPMLLRCAGSGRPTVVMDAGLGDTHVTWDWVRPDLEGVSRVCVYDRAGLGRSAPGPPPRTSGRIVEELDRLLRRAREPGPFVLVGHSFGGLNARLFAARHPERTAGLVLVDATPEAYVGREAELHPPADLRRMRVAVRRAPQAARQEWESLPESTREVAGAGPPPPVPCVVLASDDPGTAWVSMQRDLASRHPGCRFVVAEGSGHDVQFDRPDLVVEAVREVVERARAGPF